MVKKAPVPNVIEDARFYTVVHPYPLNVNCELEEDVARLCVWIASVMGLKQPFFAVHHKPTARGMLIIEIDRDFPSKPLLGEHRWSQILKQPQSEEKGRKSQIFHSFYSKMHELRDDGWKRIDLEDRHFADWHPGPGNKTFRYPYPETHWCETPKEDITNKSLCRPLPVKVKPPPPAHTTRVVPGSAAWAAVAGQPAKNGNGKSKKKKKPAAQPIPEPLPPVETPIIDDSFREPDLEPSLGPVNEQDLYEFVMGDGDGISPEDFIAPWEQVDAMSLNPPPSANNGATHGSGGSGAGPWNGAPQEKPKLVVKCPTHPGNTCKKGICADYKKALRAAEQAQREQEKQERLKAKKKDKKTGKGSASGSGSNTPSGNENASLRPGSARGGGSANNSANEDNDEWNEVPANSRGKKVGRGQRMNVNAQAADEGDPWED